MVFRSFQLATVRKRRESILSKEFLRNLLEKLHKTLGPTVQLSLKKLKSLKELMDLMLLHLTIVTYWQLVS